MNFFKKIFNAELKEYILDFKEDVHYSFMIWWKYLKDTWPLYTILIVIFIGAVYFAEPAPPKRNKLCLGR